MWRTTNLMKKYIWNDARNHCRQPTARRFNGRSGGRRLSSGRIPAAATRINSKPTSKGITKTLSTKDDGTPNTLLTKLT